MDSPLNQLQTRESNEIGIVQGDNYSTWYHVGRQKKFSKEIPSVAVRVSLEVTLFPVCRSVPRKHYLSREYRSIKYLVLLNYYLPTYTAIINLVSHANSAVYQVPDTT